MGFSGFADRKDVELVPGAARGFRWWDYREMFATPLCGSFGYFWQPGTQVAVCRAVPAVYTLTSPVIVANDSSLTIVFNGAVMQLAGTSVTNGSVFTVAGHTTWTATANSATPVAVPPGTYLTGMNGSEFILAKAATEVELETHEAPSITCSCGFWAYWAAVRDSGMPSMVSGVIEGYGRTLLGSRGFRSAKARIMALCVEKVEVSVDEARQKLSEIYEVPVFTDRDIMLSEYPPTTEFSSR